MNNKSQKLVQYSLDNKKAEIVELNNLLEDDETCKGTSLTYQNKKLSVGRAITGKILFGEEGAILGGLSSKKGYVKCLKCGHHWKL